MPKGTKPSLLMEERYNRLDAALDKAPKDKNKFEKLKRKVKEFVRGAPSDSDKTHPKYRSLLKKLTKIEANMSTKDKMAERVYEDQTP